MVSDRTFTEHSLQRSDSFLKRHNIDQRMLTYLLIQWRHIVTMSHNTFHSSRVIDKRQRRRLANVDIQLRHLVTIRSPNSFHSGHLAITVTLHGPDGDRYGQVLLYLPWAIPVVSGHLPCTATLSMPRPTHFNVKLPLISGHLQ